MDCPTDRHGDGEFQRSLHDGGSVEGGGALVVEAAAALSVDDVGGVLGVGRIDQKTYLLYHGMSQRELLESRGVPTVGA